MKRAIATKPNETNTGNAPAEALGDGSYYHNLPQRLALILAMDGDLHNRRVRLAASTPHHLVQSVLLLQRGRVFNALRTNENLKPQILLEMLHHAKRSGDTETIGILTKRCPEIIRL